MADSHDGESENNVWSDDVFQGQDPETSKGKPQIAALSNTSDGIDSSPYKSCPECNCSSSKSNSICVHCGYNINLVQLQQVAIDSNKVEFQDLNNVDKQTKVAVILKCLALACYAVVLVWVISSSDRYTASMVGIGCGLLAAAIGRIWFVILAFQESQMWGSMCIFVPFAEVVFFFHESGENVETEHDISHGLRFVTSRVRWRWNPYLGGGGIELTEEEIEEYVKDDNYMFTVEGWFADQSGSLDNSDVQYDSEFANLLSSYRDGC